MIGFNSIIESFEGAHRAGTLSHAHLIFGQDGIGKSKLAKILANIIIYNDRNSKKENNVDIKEVRVSKLSIGVDEVREILTEANTRPFEGDNKVIIIYDGEKMTVQAQNALLKTIEEPPKGVYFIILSKSANEVLPTIRSRCQNTRLFPLSNSDIKEYLDEHYNVPEDKVKELIAISKGIPGILDSFLNDENERRINDSMIYLLENLYFVKSLRDRNALKVLDLNKFILDNDPSTYFEGLLTLVRDIAILKNTKQYKNIIFLYNEMRIKKLAIAYSMTRLNKLVDILIRARDLLAQGRNINKETVVDFILLKLMEDN